MSAVPIAALVGTPPFAPPYTPPAVLLPPEFAALGAVVPEYRPMGERPWVSKVHRQPLSVPSLMKMP
ncbi:hypothetical protein [Variovorax paradoxus]|uniref:hypothetical protein n=1 Tax=Variovorax paradoxus TaxID=34073 RepID=UPI003460D742